MSEYCIVEFATKIKSATLIGYRQLLDAKCLKLIWQQKEIFAQIKVRDLAPKHK